MPYQSLIGCCQMRDNGTLYWLLGDHLGRTAYKVYATTEIGEMHYLRWGGTRFTSGQTVTSYKFTVQREEASLGLYDYGARDGTIPAWALYPKLQRIQDSTGLILEATALVTYTVA